MTTAECVIKTEVLKEYKFVQVHQHGPVATVTMNRPEIHNAFNEDFIEQLDQSFQMLSERSCVRAIVLQGIGKSFCAGADLNWMKKMKDYNYVENVEDAQGLAQMLMTIRRCKKPTIARVHGHAFGGGVGLIAACDVAVAVDDIYLGLTEVKLGIMPAVISPVVLEKIGNAHASRYFLTAERFGPKEGHHIGLIAEVVADEKALDEKIQFLLNQILKNGPEAVEACKDMIFKVSSVMRDDWTSIDNQVNAVTCELIAKRRISEEGQKGLTAFLEKSSADWVVKTSWSGPTLTP